MTIIKHSPNTAISNQIEKETTFLVKAATPYMSAIKRIDRILAKFDPTSIDHKKFQRGQYKKIQYIRVKGMGRAIDKTTSIGLHYMKNAYKVDIYTGTVEVVDEISTESYKTKDDDSDSESTFRKRNASCVEVKIWLKRQ
ncbi:CIC11C00000000796 [Sungouiella intermedia]|uniref:CIC11C00000000796 n=1 Tax=Sungouiella intermedia TaxID=45354 RepID=A0A1L0BES3_9ASCO|nr:CIC11C00000000796 [[Candida] intermedia]